jgi:hypothetical protein
MSWQARYGPLGPVVSAATFSPGQPLAPPELEEALTPAEMPALRPFINALMVEIGLAVGEPTPAEEAASPSTATSTS